MKQKRSDGQVGSRGRWPVHVGRSSDAKWTQLAGNKSSRLACKVRTWLVKQTGPPWIPAIRFSKRRRPWRRRWTCTLDLCWLNWTLSWTILSINSSLHHDGPLDDVQSADYSEFFFSSRAHPHSRRYHHLSIQQPALNQMFLDWLHF